MASTVRHLERSQIFLALGLLTWTAVALSIDNGHVGVFHDDGIYLVSAQALRDGRGYQLPSRPGNPPPKYPPGLPLATASVLRCLPGPASLTRDIAAARAVVIVSGLVFFIAAYRWLRRMRVPGPVSACVVLATAFHPSCLVGCASAIFSDLMFGALTYVTLLSIARTEGFTGRHHTGLATLSGVLAGMSILVRSNGITLVLAILTDSFRSGFHRPVRLAGNLFGLVLVLVVWWSIPKATNREVPSGDYRLEMSAAWSSPGAGVEILGRNLSAVIGDFPTRVILPATTYLSPVRRFMEREPKVWRALRAACSSVVVVGLWFLARRGGGRAYGAWVHLAGTLLLFLIWPWTMIMDRFLLWLFPLVFLAFWTGLPRLRRSDELSWKEPWHVSRRWVAVVMVLLTLQVLAVSARSVQGFFAAGRQWPGASNRAALGEALELIRSRLEPEAVVAARWPDTVFLYTGRQAVPLTEDDAILLGRFDQTDRLRLWIELVRDRPFYLLIRSDNEDRQCEDLRQARVLAKSDELSLETLASTSDGRYELIRVTRR